MKKPAGSLPIRTIASLTGVSAVTLRAWERRYGLVRPSRTPKGHRLYSHQHVERIRRVLALVERGCRSAACATCSTPSLRRRRQPPGDRWQATLERMAAAIARLRRTGTRPGVRRGPFVAPRRAGHAAALCSAARRGWESGGRRCPARSPKNISSRPTCVASSARACSTACAMPPARRIIASLRARGAARDRAVALRSGGAARRAADACCSALTRRSRRLRSLQQRSSGAGDRHFLVHGPHAGGLLGRRAAEARAARRACPVFIGGGTTAPPRRHRRRGRYRSRQSTGRRRAPHRRRFGEPAHQAGACHERIGRTRDRLGRAGARPRRRCPCRDPPTVRKRLQAKSCRRLRDAAEATARFAAACTGRPSRAGPGARQRAALRGARGVLPPRAGPASQVQQRLVAGGHDAPGGRRGTRARRDLRARRARRWPARPRAGLRLGLADPVDGPALSGSRIIAVSNSQSQRDWIAARGRAPRARATSRS